MTVVNGIKTNIPLLLQILDNPKFQSGNYTTRLIGEDFHYTEVGAGKDELRMAMVAAAVAAYTKEFKGVPWGGGEDSRWRTLGRKEALR